MRRLLVLIVAGGCGRLGFDDVAPLEVPHLPAGVTLPGTGTLVITGAIDTSALTVESGLGRASFTSVTPTEGDLDLAVLQADAIELPAGIEVRVTGARPLVLVARDVVTIAGTLDAGAHADIPGPGARRTTGEDGTHFAGDVCDRGGGGGGHATFGAFGGGTSCEPNPTSGGAAIDDAALAILEGGGAGGMGVSDACGSSTGGAGGGAIQLAAGVRVELAALGAILAGGGGGEGGRECGAGDAGSGGGGGAGGSIYVSAPELAIVGTLVVGGGGGGGAGNGSDIHGPIASGAPGADARTVTPAPGGTAPPTDGSSGNGGDGATPTVAPAPSSPATLNGGGGGGAAGRIVIVES